MAKIKTKDEIVLLKEGGKRLSAALSQVAAAAVPGATTLDLDELAEKLIREGGDEPAFLNYQPRGAKRPYPATLCTSINDEIVHGIPSADRVLRAGDIIGLDIGLVHKGLITDMAVTVAVGGIATINDEVRTLMEATKKALNAGVNELKHGNTLGDVGAAIEAIGRAHGYGIVEELGGHFVGHAVHEDPFIANLGERGKGVKLEEGMVVAIEPLFNLGARHVELASDGFTYITRDSSLSAHYEMTIAVGRKGPDILTPAPTVS